ncbi:MAG TPA: uracil-DNA glycosylase [Bryobacteraceae bacterium]|jgi:uracil-DNA glycosylase family 4|nr:uracil-DNA glycosylase [Bryobacteraceae bacterium]
MQLTEMENCAPLRVLKAEIVACRRCPRLVAYREEIGRVQRRAYRGQNYWSKPVPGFGDPAAQVLIIGLAPGAHGANRTGRMFTGDRSGEFLYRALWEAGFANQPESISAEDGLRLSNAYITSPVRCVPPENKPNRDEILNCRPYLVRELDILKKVQVVVALGAIGFDSYLSVLQGRGSIRARAPFHFAHGAVYQTHAGGPLLLGSYHPSQQNTSTGKLSYEMLRDIFVKARDLAAKREEPQAPGFVSQKAAESGH